MTREDICTCAQYSQCPVCNKSRGDYNELMREHEALVAVLRLARDKYGPNTPVGQIIRDTLYVVTGDENYIQEMPKWARERARTLTLHDVAQVVLR